jgi:RNA polymerase sigma factor for flagellar operon FliA
MSRGSLDTHGEDESAAPTSDEEHELWRRRGSDDMSAVAELAERYLPYAKYIAARLYKQRTDNDVPFDDYFQLASLGLMEAVNRFDVSQGVAFTTFANYRIRGAVLNGLQSTTERRNQAAYIRRNRAQRAESLQGPATSDEKAAFTGMVDVIVGLAIGLLIEQEVAAETTSTDEPFDARALADVRRLVGAAVDDLPPRERLIVRFHYFQHVPFEEIAVRLNVTKGRVSQLHKRALERIRSAISGRPGLDDYF